MCKAIQCRCLEENAGGDGEKLVMEKLREWVSIKLSEEADKLTERGRI